MMARQDAENAKQTERDVVAWLEGWREEQLMHPRRVDSMAYKLEPGENVSVVIRIDDERLAGFGYNDRDFLSACSEAPLCIIREVLTKDTALRLNTAHKLIADMQGATLGESNSLAYIIYVWQLVRGYGASKRGGPSIVCGPVIEDNETYARMWPILIDKPVATLDAILSFWEQFGQRLASGFIVPPRSQRGVFDYRVMPPGWVSADVYQQVTGRELPPSPRLLLVDPNVAELAECLQKGQRDLHFSLVSNKEELISEPANTKGIGFAEELDAPVDPGRSVFRRCGATWLVIYAGKRVTVDHCDGMTYIRHLLEKANTPVPVDELHRLAYPPGPSDGQFDHADGDFPTIDGVDRGYDDGLLTIADVGHAYDDDEVFLSNYRAALEEIAAEEEQAARRCDPTELAEVRKRKKKLERFIASEFGKRGNRRTMTDPKKKQRQAVQRAIKTALAKINATLPELGNHLSSPPRRLKTGADCVYLPGGEIHWETE